MLPDPTAPDVPREKPLIVPIKIWTDHEPVNGTSEYQAVEYVEWAKKGTNGATTVDKIARVKKTPNIWGVIEPYYEAWKKGQEDPVDGTPLSAWPGVTRGQVDQLKSLHIRTVQDVAALTDSDLERVGMGARRLRDLARAFVKAADQDADISAALAERDAQIEEMQRQIAELQDANAQLAKNRQKRAKPADAAAGAA